MIQHLKIYTSTLRYWIVAAMLTVTIALSAQTHYIPHVWVGAHGGMTLSEIAFSPSVRKTFNEGFTGGVSFRFAEERHVGLLAELNIVQRGWKENFEEDDFEYNRQLTYVSLPIMTHIFFGSRVVKFFVNLGPEVCYMIGERINSNFDYKNPNSVPGFPTHNRSTEQMGMEIKNRFDYGISGGLGAEFVIKKRHSIYVEGRYYFGLGNIYSASKKDTFSASRHSSIMVTLGYHLRIK